MESIGDVVTEELLRLGMKASKSSAGFLKTW